MNIAVIIAGGSGHRMGQDIPKQFINVYDKPVLIYTLEGFQDHPQIDAIEVVCIDGWHDVLRAYAKQFNITKLKWIVSGGDSGQESIRNGVYNLEGKASADDIIVIHDGIRPLVDASVLTDVLLKAKKYGNAVTSLPYNEQIYGSSYTNTMMVELGETLHFASGSDKNIKLTTKDDLELFKAYLKADKDTWLK